MKKITLALYCFFCSVILLAQNSPYTVSFKQDFPIISIGTSLLISEHFLQKKVQAATLEEINQLHAKDIWKFDRSATKNWSPIAAKHSDIVLYSSFLLPLTLLTDQPIRKDYLTLGVLFSEVFLANMVITNFTKISIQRSRPFLYNPTAPMSRKLHKDAQLAFFSGHTSMTSALCFFTAKVFQDYHPNNKFNPLIWSTMASIPAITGYLRYRAGKHFPTDILTGYIVGALVGVLIPTLHKKQ